MRQPAQSAVRLRSAATSNFTVTATDGNGATGSRAYSVTINATISVNPATLPAATVGTPYSQIVSATGGTGTYTFSVTAGSLPAGLTLNAATGAITGTPSSAATSSFTITATDGNGATGSRAYSVTANPAIVVNPATLPGGTVSAAYSQTVSATGGSGSYTFSVSVGTLPAGLTLNASTGLISGTPTTAATSAFTIRAVDGNGAVGTRAYSVTVNAGMVVGPATLPTATIGSAVFADARGDGRHRQLHLQRHGGQPAAGIDAQCGDGRVVRNAHCRGNERLHHHRDRWQRCHGIARLCVHRQPGAGTQPGEPSERHRRRGLLADGGRHWRQRQLHLQRYRGRIAGRSDAERHDGCAVRECRRRQSTSSFTITATDGGGATVARAYTVTISAAIVVSPATVPGGTVGSPYSQTITSTGGNGTFTYSVSSGSLPAGLTLNASTGLISGTPTTAGTSTFTVTTTDGAGLTGARSYTVAIVAATLTLDSTTLGNGVVGSPYTQSIVVSGGVAPYVYSIVSGQLPTGVTSESDDRNFLSESRPCQARTRSA